MSPFLSEFLGTAILITIGNGTVANVVLQKTKGHNSGWIVITVGWAMAVFVGVSISEVSSGAHLNPAVSIALALAGKFAWSDVPSYILAQMFGAMVGTTAVWLAYRDHYDATEDHDTIRATFCTSPAIVNVFNNFLTELIGTFVLILSILYMVAPASSLGALDALPVAFLVLGIGIGLGGSTGYAINPARDLGPRIMYYMLPLKHKGSSGWSYSWIPVAGPISGGILAAMIFNLFT
ncbi:MAG: aquaporin family protein [Saprospiraceae bacterium]|nr:aquaporin family protein [Saprospiraceae bacterium]